MFKRYLLTPIPVDRWRGDALHTMDKEMQIVRGSDEWVYFGRQV